MNLYLYKELQLFVLSVIFGAAILFFYDFFRILRRLIPHSTAAVAIQDLLFWIVTGFSIFALLYRYNNGSIRGYCILGMGFGMVAYGAFFSPFLIKVAVKIGNFIKKILRKLAKRVIIISKTIKCTGSRRSHSFFRWLRKILYGK